MGSMLPYMAYMDPMGIVGPRIGSFCEIGMLFFCRRRSNLFKLC